MSILSYLFINLSIPLNILSIALSISVIVYSVILLLKAHPNAIAIAGRKANFIHSRYINEVQNIIQKLQPNGAFRVTFFILPFVSIAVSIPAIVFG